MINNDNGCINADCIGAMRAGRTLDDLAGRQHVDTEYHGRLMQLPTATPAVAVEPDLWSTDRLDSVL